MKSFRRTRGSSLTLFALLSIAAAVPGSAHAQDTAQAGAQKLDRERITQFARAHLAIAEARDQFHGEIARVHDEEGRLRAREEVDAKIAEILGEQEMTREEYDEFILRISLDGELRATFEEILAELQEPGEPG